MKAYNTYIISGGAEGKKRLDILSGVLRNSTQALLQENGLARGSSFLDVGCGGGNVSLMAAQMTGPEGNVTAIDFDESIITLNRQDAEQQQVQNITYHALDATAIEFEDEFDIAYSRFLLSHLTDPLLVLRKMLKSVKPGGKIIIEDIHFSGHFCYPPCPAFDEYVRLFTVTAQQRWQNPEIGQELFALFHDAGISEVNFDVIQPAFSEGDGKRMAVITMEKTREAVIAQGLADSAAIEKIIEELEAFTNDENTIISLPRIFRVWGSKAR